MLSLPQMGAEIENSFLHKPTEFLLHDAAAGARDKRCLVAAETQTAPLQFLGTTPETLHHTRASTTVPANIVIRLAPEAPDDAPELRSRKTILDTNPSYPWTLQQAQNLCVMEARILAQLPGGDDRKKFLTPSSPSPPGREPSGSCNLSQNPSSPWHVTSKSHDNPRPNDQGTDNSDSYLKPAAVANTDSSSDPASESNDARPTCGQVPANSEAQWAQSEQMLCRPDRLQAGLPMNQSEGTAKRFIMDKSALRLLAAEDKARLRNSQLGKRLDLANHIEHNSSVVPNFSDPDSTAERFSSFNATSSIFGKSQSIPSSAVFVSDSASIDMALRCSDRCCPERRIGPQDRRTFRSDRREHRGPGHI